METIVSSITQTALKFSLKRDALLSALALVMKFVASRGLPILGCFHIEAGEAGLIISGTDLEVGMRLRVEACVETGGICMIHAKTFLDCVKTLGKGQEVAIRVQDDRLVLSSGKRTFKLNYWRDADVFPELPRVISGNACSVNSDVLRQAIKEVEFCAADDESRPVFTALCLRTQGNTADLIGANTFRMARRIIALKDVSARHSTALIPVQSMRLLAGALPCGVDVMIHWNVDQILFEAGPVQVISRIVEGEYPDCVRAIPGNHQTTFTLKATTLDQILKSFAPFYKDSSNILKIFYGCNAAIFKASSEDLGEVEEELDIPVEGEEDYVFLNAQFLVDLLKGVQSESVTFHLSGGDKPGVLAPTGRDDYQYLVMPMSPNR